MRREHDLMHGGSMTQTHGGNMTWTHGGGCCGPGPVCHLISATAQVNTASAPDGIKTAFPLDTQRRLLQLQQPPF